MWIPSLRLFGSALLVASATTAVRSQAVQLTDIAIVFASPAGPRPDREDYSRYGQFLSVDKPTGGTVSFRSVDPSTKGSFASLVHNRVAKVTVTWSDQTRLKSQAQTASLLRELLTTSRSTMYTFHIWSWGDVEPSVLTTVEHRDGKQGRWIIWCAPIVYWAYQDGNGLWWWGGADDPKGCESEPERQPRTPEPRTAEPLNPEPRLPGTQEPRNPHLQIF